MELKINIAILVAVTLALVFMVLNLSSHKKENFAEKISMLKLVLCPNNETGNL